MNVLLANVGLVNLVAASAVLIAGLVIYFFSMPKAFAGYAYMKRAFEYWLLQWSAIVLLYIIYWIWSGGSRIWVLAGADLQSVFAFGFAFVMIAGGDYRRQRTIPSLVILFVILALWNLGFAGSALHSPPLSMLRRLWVFPSEVASATSLILIAFVFLRRYGYRTAGLTIVIAAYLLLQRPAYAGLFVKPPENRDWLLLLAFGKLLYGCVMYATFFLDAREHGPIALPTFGLQNEQMQKLARGAIAVVCGTIIHMAAFYAAVALQPFVTR